MTDTKPTAQQKYDEFMAGDSEKSALERLRFFCSLSMNGQDWLDVEKYFNDVESELKLIQSAEMPVEPERIRSDYFLSEHRKVTDYIDALKAYALRKEVKK
jgi:hypothetical protein